ncbi:MAG: tetratricopeptide repeat protein, partial [Bacteroidales bacterium]|nr:tetratricopeptide repeat protein [Bacteroidales bacterium]
VDVSNLNIIQARLQYSLMNDTGGKKADMLRTAILRRIRQSPDLLVFSELMLWFSVQKQDFELALIQAMALDRRLGENGNRVHGIAQLSMANQQYETAIKAHKYLIEKGEGSFYYLISRVDILNAEYLLLTSRIPADMVELKALETKYKEALNDLGRSRLTIQLMRNLAHLQAFMLYETENAIAILNAALILPGISQRDQAECKLELADILLYSGDVWESTLLYSQAEKTFPNEPIGHEAKFRNARLSFFIEEFEWARAQLDVLKAATSKLIANDAMALSLLIKDNMDQDSTYTALSYYARAELNSFRNRDDLAMNTLDSILALFPYHSIHDDVLMKKAEICVRKAKYNDAVVFLQKIVDDFAYDLLADKAMFRLGEVYQHYLNDHEKAMSYFKELLLQHPGSLYAAPARERFRQMRGDPI